MAWTHVRAQWAEDGIPVGASTASQQSNRMVSDGQGGAIITWWETRNAVDSDIYAQRVDGDGNTLWIANGVAISTASGHQRFPRIVPDGAGGAVMVWHDQRGADFDLYAQRVDANGTVMWAANGVPISVATGDQVSPVLAGDGNGGAIIAWQDLRLGVNSDLYAQHVDANGQALWTIDGMAISTQLVPEGVPRILSDGVGGAILVWHDSRGGVDADLWGQRVDATGTLKWVAAGVAVSAAAGHQRNPVIVSDGAHGAIVVWDDTRVDPQGDVYATRLREDGAKIWSDTPICTAASWQLVWALGGVAPDGAGGAFIVWEDARGTNTDIYAQRVDPFGDVSWTVDGAVVRTGFGDDAFCPAVIADGLGGALIVWEDERHGHSDIYAQRLDGAGSIHYPLNGVGLSVVPGPQQTPQLVAGSPGSVITSWMDFRNTSTSGADIYAQRTEAHFGHWGRVAGQMSAVTDVPADQGGHVSVRWAASRLDVLGDQTLSHYSIWRATPVASLARTGPRVVDPITIPRDFAGPAYRMEQTATGDFFWEWIANSPVAHFSNYAYTAPTLNDSIPGNAGTHYFQVLTHATDPTAFWVSQVDSGYSVDNLAPGTPLAFAGTPVPGGGLALTWKASPEADFSRYALYRATTAGFVPGASNLLAEFTDTTTVDTQWTSSNIFFYKLAAKDVHENESATASISPNDIVPTLLQGFTAQSSTNAVEITWRLFEAGLRVRFYVLRAQLPDGEFVELPQPNIHSEGLFYSFRDTSYQPATTYKYRVDVSDEDGRRLLFETRPLSTPGLTLALNQNYPNPFNPTTTISFSLPEPARVELSVYNLDGKRVRTLVSERLKAGLKEYTWDGRNERGNPVSTGIYLYRLHAGKRTLSKKMILLK